MPPPQQPDGGDYYRPRYHREVPAAAGSGQVLHVSPEDVLAKYRAVHEEAHDFGFFLRRHQDRLRMRPCGNDPVSHDVARAVTEVLLTNPDSYYQTCLTWQGHLYDTAEQLRQVALQYGYTESDIAASLGGSTAPDA